MKPLWHQFAGAVVVASVATLAAADSPQRAFAKQWEGRTVIARQTLYSVVFDERGRLGKTYASRHDGLTVVTAAGGTYFQFDARQGRDDVMDQSAERVYSQLAAMYDADELDVRSYRKLEPRALVRYDASAEFLVTGVRVGRDSIRVLLGDSAHTADDPLTTLTVKWPVPLSPAFSEREVVDALLTRFLQIKTTSSR